MRDGELSRLDIRKDAQNCVLAGAGIDVDSIARKPSQELWFRMHSAGGRARPRGANIFLGLKHLAGLGGTVPLAEVVTRSYFIDLSAYPRWLVVLVGTLIAALIIWILMKVLKWALWLLFFAVLAGGLFWTGYLLVR
jgi:hypothetical protein